MLYSRNFSRPFHSAGSLKASKYFSKMSSSYIKRTTLFKVPEEYIDEVLQAYTVLRKNAVKVRRSFYLEA